MVDVLRAIWPGRDAWSWNFFASGEREIVYSQTSQPFAAFDGKTLSPEVRSYLLDPSRTFQQRESIVSLRGGGYVLPDGGWIVSGSWNLVDSGLIDSEYAPRPSFLRYLRQRLTAGAAIRDVPRLVHLRDRGETNYWHFLNDIVGGRLRLALRTRFGHDFPLLIGRRALERQFVRDILNSSDLAGKIIIVQDNELVRYREAICFETPRHSLESIDFFLKYLGSTGGRASAKRRILLVRGREARRPMRNFPEIQAVCERYGFETIRPDNLSIRDQAKVFSEVRYLVAEHGAGLANIAFRRGAPLSLLEIFPTWRYVHPGGLIGHPPPHYFWLARSLGFEYDALAGRTMADDEVGAFSVDPRRLDEKLSRMLAYDKESLDSFVSETGNIEDS
jgi:hypothetical protein